MTKIVSNATPTISLLKLDRLELLQQLYSRINIPSAVYREIEAGKSKAYYKDLLTIECINIIKIQDKQAVKYFLDFESEVAPKSPTFYTATVTI